MKIIGRSKNGNPIIVKLKGIVEKVEEKQFSILYVVSELINGNEYNVSNAQLVVANIEGRPEIKGRGSVTIQTKEGPVTDAAIADIPAIDPINNYENFLQAYRESNQYNFALDYIEKNHVIA